MISAVVCTYNRSESLRDTLRALIQQMPPEDGPLEILVVDNNSTDRTKQVIEEVAGHSEWPIRYLFEARQGKSHALNAALQEVRGKIVAFTDDDVIPDRSWIQALQKAFQTHQADCVGGKILPLWAQPPPDWLSGYSLWGVLALLDRGPHPILARPSDPAFLFGANIAFRKEVFAEVGIFRTDLGPQGKIPSLAEDTEMLRRLLRVGKRVVYAPDAVVHHKVPPERMRMSYHRRWWYFSGRSLARVSSRGTKAMAWRIRLCLAKGVAALWNHVRGDRREAAHFEAEFWTQLGIITEWTKQP